MTVNFSVMRKFTPLTAFASLEGCFLIPAPYWGQDVNAAIIFNIRQFIYYCWGYFHTWAPAQLVFFNPKLPTRVPEPTALIRITLANPCIAEGTGSDPASIL